MLISKAIKVNPKLFPWHPKRCLGFAFKKLFSHKCVSPFANGRQRLYLNYIPKILSLSTHSHRSYCTPKLTEDFQLNPTSEDEETFWTLLRNEGFKPQTLTPEAKTSELKDFFSSVQSVMTRRVLRPLTRLYLPNLGTSDYSDISVAILLYGFGKFKELDNAEVAWERLKNRNNSLLIYTAMIYVFANCGQLEFSFDILMKMRKIGLRDCSYHYNVILEACALYGNYHFARRLLNDMYEVYQVAPDLDSWNSLIKCYARLNKLNNAETVLFWMKNQEHVPNPNVDSYRLIIEQYSRQKSTEDALRLFEQLEQDGLVPDKACWRRVIEVLARTSRIEYAFELFDRMKISIPSSTLLENILLSCCRRQNRLDLFRQRFGDEKINRVNPYDIDEERQAFIRAQLSDCSPVRGKGWVEIESPLSDPRLDTRRQREETGKRTAVMDQLEKEFLKKVEEDERNRVTTRDGRFRSSISILRESKKKERGDRKVLEDKEYLGKKSRFYFREE